MVLPSIIIANSEMDTVETAAEFSKILRDGDVILLCGDLGVGKTFFVKSVCSEFSITNVSSPSFAILNEYVGTKTIYHFDFYRIKRARELFDIGIIDYFNNDAITFIEWADLYPEVLPKKNYKIEFEFANETKRKLTITKNG